MILKLSSVGFFTLLLVACGGGVSQHEPREEKSLYFVDAPTNGIDYACGERRGVTKTYTFNNITKHGAFKCVYSPINFSLGRLNLGSINNVVNNQTIYPQDLVDDFNGDFNNQEVLKIAIILQSLNDKSNPNYLNIPQSTKDKITLTSLKGLSINAVSQAIRDMGFTPVSAETARIHLILNSPNAQSGKPIIKPFEEEVSTDLRVGDSIGKLNIDSGDGTLIYPFILDGSAKEHFMLNNNGKLILTQSFNIPQTVELNVSISNEFGFSTVPIIIHVKDSGKIGKVQMGRLKNATVNIFKLLDNGKKELVTTESTNAQGNLNILGNFDLHTELLEDQSFYIYEVREGFDVDIDDDGEEDKTPTKNHGVMHLITKGIWLKNANQKIRITPLSEMLYSYALRDNFNDLENSLTKYSEILLKTSLDNNNKIDAQDILLFNPLSDKSLLYETLIYNNGYNNIVQQLRAGNANYKNSIFNAFIVESFQSNSIEIVGSSIYTIDMLNSGEFRIYDLETKALIGKIKLPNTPVEEDSHLIYVNLSVGEVRISSLTDWAYELLISNQTKPLLDGEPFTKELLMSGSFNHITLAQGEVSSIFGKERQTHLYNLSTDTEDTRNIKYLNVDKHNIFYQFEFDSQLKNIESLWVNNDYLYVIGDNKLNIFHETNTEANLTKVYTEKKVSGNIVGIEENILYILKNNLLTLYDINSESDPKFIESFFVPFNYKLGIKTNGKYITTGSKIIDLHSLKAANIKP
ncbi:MAG: Unknown protein [uncultured Sulfurovum sp.]|uniref:Cadherin domain-containing protein n=1 Tax=uncultured Sulfurovum sp. TaxID=269237 RepID=A0A6S6TE36_9BACT|nr:MAG: Unknown protein [uncultured Sulfurovum sp.]